MILLVLRLEEKLGKAAAKLGSVKDSPSGLGKAAEITGGEDRISSPSLPEMIAPGDTLISLEAALSIDPSTAGTK